MPAMLLNSSAAKCVALPVPPEENSNSPGFAFASAMSSLTDLMPSYGLTTSTDGTLMVVVMPAKSFTL